jgi:hypothetical protein
MKRDLVGAALLVLGIGAGVLVWHTHPTAVTWPLVVLILVPIALGAYLLDPADLGPVVQRALTKVSGGSGGGPVA